MRVAENGFEVHWGVVSEADLAAAAEPIGSLGGGRSRAGARRLMGHPVVAALAGEQRLVGLAEAALGRGAQPFRATLFAKSPASNWLVTWHQDIVVPVRSRRDVPGWGPWSVKAGVLHAHAAAHVLEAIVALHVHLDDSRPHNGPLRVLPGTRLHGVFPEEAIRQRASSVPPHELTCPRGGVIVMKPLLLHASSKSVKPELRRVLHIEYARSLRLDGGLELAIS